MHALWRVACTPEPGGGREHPRCLLQPAAACVGRARCAPAALTGMRGCRADKSCSCKEKRHARRSLVATRARAYGTCERQPGAHVPSTSRGLVRCPSRPPGPPGATPWCVRTWPTLSGGVTASQQTQRCVPAGGGAPKGQRSLAAGVVSSCGTAAYIHSRVAPADGLLAPVLAPLACSPAA